MKAYIISIVGVICLGILLEIVLPEGKTAKYVRGAFSLLIVFVIAQPLPALLKKDYKLSFNGGELALDGKYEQEVYSAYSQRLAKLAEDRLLNGGIRAQVEVELSDAPNENRIKRVYVASSGDASAIKSALADLLNIRQDIIFVSRDGFASA